jgi:hypothetical protein
VPRGDDCRAAAGFLCRMLDRSLGRRDTAGSVSIDLSFVGSEIRVYDKNLGELVTIPGFRIPMSVPVAVTHKAILALAQNDFLMILLFGLNLKIPIPLRKLVPGLPKEVKLRCWHLTVKHPDGHEGPCKHITVQHDHDLVFVPCTHLTVEHEYDTVPVVGTHIPCIHVTVEHDNDGVFAVPCSHITMEHKSDHYRCVHPAFMHKWHRFSLEELSIDFPSFGSAFVKHMVLICAVFEQKFDNIKFILAVIQSNHSLAGLFRALVSPKAVRPLIIESIRVKAVEDFRTVFSVGRNGPSNAEEIWGHDNRWVRCSDPAPRGDGRKVFNGLDFMAFENMMIATGVGRPRMSLQDTILRCNSQTLAAYWPLNELQGNSCNDLVGGHHASLPVNGGVKLGARDFGNSKAPYFNGELGSWLEVQCFERLSQTFSDSLSVVLWLNPEVLDFRHHNKGWLDLVKKCTDAFTDTEWCCRMYNLAPDPSHRGPRPSRLCFYMFNLDAKLGNGAYSQEAVQPREWIMLVGQAEAYSQSSGCLLWRNGERSERSKGDKYHGEEWTVKPQAGPGKLWIGGVPGKDGEGGMAFQGSLAHIAIWNCVLSHYELRNIYEAARMELK